MFRLMSTVLALCVLAMAVPAAAQDVTFRFTGVITQPPEDFSFPEIVEGTEFTGAYTCHEVGGFTGSSDRTSRDPGASVRTRT